MILRSDSRRSVRPGRRRLAIQKLDNRRVLASMAGVDLVSMTDTVEAGSTGDTIPIANGLQILVEESNTFALTDEAIVVIGDETSGDTYGSMFVEQALVHYIRPAVSRYETRIVMVPGRNLTSSTFLETPDGRAGWAHMFAEEGYDVYVINDPNFDFSRGFNINPFSVPTIGAPPADPGAMRAWQQDIWRRWGFGDSQENPYPDTRFPTDQFTIFESNYPYVSNAGQNYSDALISLLENIGSAVVMAHSAGASVTVNAATSRPDLVDGLFMIEPAGPPDAGDFPALAGMSMLGVYGDYLTSRNQTGRKEATEAAAVLFNQFGGIGEVISLPDDHAIFGNTHLMMQDNNNDFIADLMIDWLSDNALGAERDTPLVRGSTSIIPITSGLSRLAKLPSGELLVVGTDTTTGDSAWVVDPLAAAVTATDVTTGRRVLPWSQLAIDGNGYGVLLQQSASDVAVRSVDASAPTTTIAVAATDTMVPASTHAVASDTGNRTALTWNTPGGLDVLLWDNIHAVPIGSSSTIPGPTEALAFDDASGLLAVRTTNGGLDLIDVDSAYSVAYSIDDVDGEVVIAGDQNTLATINTDGLLRWFDLQSGAKIAEATVDLVELGSVVDIAVSWDGLSTVLLTTLGLTKIETPKVAPSVERVVVNNGEHQRSALSNLSIQFSTLIDVPLSAFRLTNQGTSGQPTDQLVTGFTLSLFDQDGKSSVNLAFADGAPVEDGNYRLFIGAAQVVRRGAQETMTHDYRFGESDADQFFQLYGDANGDGFVDFNDFANDFLPAFGSSLGMVGYQDALDLNRDEHIDFTDFAQGFLPRFGTSR